MSSRSRLTSLFSRLTSADSSLVTPGRVPSSTSAWANQRRTDSRETPSWRATAVTAAVKVGYSCRCSRTSRTHLARSSGSIFFGMLSILPDSNSNGIKPGSVQCDAAAAGRPWIVLAESTSRSREAVEPRLVDYGGELHAELFVQDEFGESVSVDEVDGGGC